MKPDQNTLETPVIPEELTAEERKKYTTALAAQTMLKLQKQGGD